MKYFASFLPLVRESLVLCQDGFKKPSTLKVNDAFSLMEALNPEDELWLMMGSTNATIALAAFRKGVTIHQISFPRISSWLAKNGEVKEAEEETSEEEKTESFGRKTKVSPSQIRAASIEAPEIFYSMSVKQGEVLEIISALQALLDAMEARKAAANLLRTRVQREALLYGKFQGWKVSTNEDLKRLLDDLLGSKDEKGRKLSPFDPHLKFLTQEEELAREKLDRICKKSPFFAVLFGQVEGVGPAIGARFISAIERIERFEKPEDLSNYAGMLPRGKEGKMPSKKGSKGQMLSRSPRLNTACFLLQDQMFQWGRKSELGQMLDQQIQQECPCAQEERAKDKELRRKYVEAVTRARIKMTRHFLEKIVFPRWREYIQG